MQVDKQGVVVGMAIDPLKFDGCDDLSLSWNCCSLWKGF